MTPRARARLLWLLAAATVAHALVSVVVYYATGRFGPAWFAASLLAYGALLLAALALAVTDPGRDALSVPVAGAEVPPRLVEHEIAYATATSDVLRLVHLHADGRRETSLLLRAGGRSTPLHEVEAGLDDAPKAPASPLSLADVDAALAARAAPAKVVP